MSIVSMFGGTSAPPANSGQGPGRANEVRQEVRLDPGSAATANANSKPKDEARYSAPLPQTATAEKSARPEEKPKQAADLASSKPRGFESTQRQPDASAVESSKDIQFGEIVPFSADRPVAPLPVEAYLPGRADGAEDTSASFRAWSQQVQLDQAPSAIQDSLSAQSAPEGRGDAVDMYMPPRGTESATRENA